MSSSLLSVLVTPGQNSALLAGAGDGTRTRDNLLGRQELCQLSYSRSSSIHILDGQDASCQSGLWPTGFFAGSITESISAEQDHISNKLPARNPGHGESKGPRVQGA